MERVCRLQLRWKHLISGEIDNRQSDYPQVLREMPCKMGTLPSGSSTNREWRPCWGGFFWYSYIYYHNIIPYNIVSCEYHIISYHIISYHITSYHIISINPESISHTTANWNIIQIPKPLSSQTQHHSPYELGPQINGEMLLGRGLSFNYTCFSSKKKWGGICLGSLRNPCVFFGGEL